MASPDTREDIDRVSILRHDVINPLTVILAYARVIARRTDVPADVIRYAEQILIQARRCVDIFERDRVANSGEAPRTVVLEDGATSDAGQAESVSILVVDDDAGIRSLSREVIEWGLMDSGKYSAAVVGCAEVASEAIDVVRDHQIDCAVIDLNVGRPGGGLDLAAEIERIQPGISSRIVFMSGGVLDKVTEARLDTMKVTMLYKPFSIHDLVKAVMQALLK